MSENATPPKRKFKVVIIGAGMAGLSAANHLIKNGFNDFHILEARERIGGRIVSIDMNSQKVTEPIINSYLPQMHLFSYLVNTKNQYNQVH